MTTAPDMITILQTINACRHEYPHPFREGEVEIDFKDYHGTVIGSGFRSETACSMHFATLSVINSALQASGSDLLILMRDLADKVMLGTAIGFKGYEAQKIYNAIPLGTVTRNDNEGIW